ncbi:hypothetical protein [Agrobacterium sp. CG674]
MKTANIVFEPNTRLGTEPRQYNLKVGTAFVIAGTSEAEREKAILSLGKKAIRHGEATDILKMVEHRIAQANNAYLRYEIEFKQVLEAAQQELGSITIRNALVAMDATTDEVIRLRFEAAEGEKVRVIHIEATEDDGKTTLKEIDPFDLVEAIEYKF